MYTGKNPKIHATIQLFQDLTLTERVDVLSACYNLETDNEGQFIVYTDVMNPECVKEM